MLKHQHVVSRPQNQIGYLVAIRSSKRVKSLTCSFMSLNLKTQRPIVFQAKCKDRWCIWLVHVLKKKKTVNVVSFFFFGGGG